MPDAGSTRGRYRRIMRFAARHLAVMWWFELLLPRVGLGRYVARGRSARMRRLARRFHVMAIELGGLMIKLGQFMSSRLDVLPPEITRELEGLQDEAPAVPFGLVRELAERELGMPLDRAYSWFEPAPLAAASLGQVHRARLSSLDEAETGISDAVVKVQRPGIEAIVAVDLAALRRVAQWLSRVGVVARRVDMPALIEEFAETSLAEIDYLHEAANAERFAEDFADDPRVSVPEIVWERTTRRVLTLSDVSAIKINDRDALLAAGIDPSEVAARFAAIMFDQLFSYGYFHADPHPGNLFVTPTLGADAQGGPAWRITFVDFGMMGEVPSGTLQGLRRMLIAAAARDGKGLVAAMRDLGALLPTADTDELERAMAGAFARFGGMGVAELREVEPSELRVFAMEFGDLVRSLPFQLPEDFLLIVRSMSMTSGMCSALDPSFNLWDAVEPYAAQLVHQERAGVVRALAQEGLEAAGVVARLPRRLDALITRLEDGRLAVAAPTLQRRIAGLERALRRLASAILFAALLVAGALVRPVDDVLGAALMAVSVLPLAHALFAGVVGRAMRRGPR